MYVIICADYMTELKAYGLFDNREEASSVLETRRSSFSEIEEHLIECGERHTILEVR